MHMKWEDHGIKTPLARAKGLGAARGAVDAWIKLRVSAIANVFLFIWFLWFLSTVIGKDHAAFTEALADPRNAIAMILLSCSIFYHSRLGSREIVEDYIHNEYFKIFKLVGAYLFYVAAAAACVFSVLKIAFTVGGV